jgi:hypothetical protein
MPGVDLKGLESSGLAHFAGMVPRVALDQA